MLVESDILPIVNVAGACWITQKRVTIGVKERDIVASETPKLTSQYKQ